MTPKGRNKKFYVLIRRVYKGEIDKLYIIHHNSTLLERQLREKGYYVLQARQKFFYRAVQDKYAHQYEYWEKHKRWEYEYFYIKNCMDLDADHEFVDVQAIPDNEWRMKG